MNVYTYPLNNHLVVFRPQDKQLFILNPTAQWIWESRAVGFDPGEIARNMAERFSLPLDNANADVQKTLSQWSASHLEPGRSQPVPKNSAPCQSNGVVYKKAALPNGGAVTFEKCFRFGQSDITIRDYTGVLADLVEPLTRNLPPAAQRETQGHVDILMDDHMFVVTHNGLETGRDASDIAAVGLVVQAMLELGYANTPMAAYVHGAAGALNGQGVLLPGMGGSGKSTLMASLVNAGWTYLCDDTVPLDTSGNILPVPLNICLKAGSWPPLKPLYPDLDTQPVYQRIGQPVRYLPMDGATSPAQKAHWIVFPQFAPDGPVQTQALPPEQVLERLVQAHAWIAPHPANARALFTWLDSIPACEMRYSTTPQAIDTLTGLVQS